MERWNGESRLRMQSRLFWMILQGVRRMTHEDWKRLGVPYNIGQWLSSRVKEFMADCHMEMDFPLVE